MARILSPCAERPKRARGMGRSTSALDVPCDPYTIVSYLQKIEGMLCVLVLSQVERQDVGGRVRAQQPVQRAMPGVEAHL